MAAATAATPEPAPAFCADVQVGERLRIGLGDIYGFYRRGEQMLAHIHRDAGAVPAVIVAARRAREQRWLATNCWDHFKAAAASWCGLPLPTP